MRVLFIGNSITKGEIGASFVNLFKDQYPDWIIKNAGVNGDTLKNISDRIEKELDVEEEYDFIVVEAGYNDIILPYLDTRGLLFQFGLRYLHRRGRRPVSAEKFEVKLGQMIDFIQSKCSSQVMITTIGCINENLSSVVNLPRKAYNRSIFQVANNHHCLVADVSEAMESALHDRPQTDYILNSFLNTIYFDKKICRKAGGAESLSKTRNLLLTIDGVHLNAAGALIYKETIDGLIRKEVENISASLP